uniref:C2H2-type domain-containing protein n=1 Tax=Plectus sambesii TaxID=2011161 RepID=A0A914W3U9_9BILA
MGGRMKLRRFLSKMDDGCCRVCGAVCCSRDHIVTHLHRRYSPFVIAVVRLRLPATKRRWGAIVRQRYRRRSSFKPVVTALFNCHRCSFATNSVRLLKDHSCNDAREQSTTSSSSGSDEATSQESKSAVGAHRSRCKDALGLLERADDPDDFQLPDYASKVASNFDVLSKSAGGLPVPSLRFLAGALVPTKGSHFVSCPTDLLFLDLPSSSRTKPQPCKFSTGVYCPACHSTFVTFGDFDDHLDPETGCNDIVPDPIQVGLRAESNVPIEFDIGQRYPKFLLSNCSTKGLRCSLCAKTAFDTIDSFHQHLLYCGGKQICDSFALNFGKLSNGVEQPDMDEFEIEL